MRGKSRTESKVAIAKIVALTGWIQSRAAYGVT